MGERKVPTIRNHGGNMVSRLATLAVSVAMIAIVAVAPAQTGTPRTGHIDVNGLNYYYEIQGRGQPLLLLHGGLGSVDMFRPILPQLVKERQVIAVDLQGDRKSTRLNSSHLGISYAVFCL